MEKATQIHLNCCYLPLAYHHSHFLAATLDFTSFFTLFLQLGCFGLDKFIDLQGASIYGHEDWLQNYI